MNNLGQALPNPGRGAGWGLKLESRPAGPFVSFGGQPALTVVELFSTAGVTLCRLAVTSGFLLFHDYPFPVVKR